MFQCLIAGDVIKYFQGPSKNIVCKTKVSIGLAFLVHASSNKFREFVPPYCICSPSDSKKQN